MKPTPPATIQPIAQSRKRNREIDACRVCANQRAGGRADPKNLRDAREDSILRAFESSRVECVDRPRVDCAVAESGCDAIENFRRDKVPVVIRVEVDDEGGGMQRASEHDRDSPADSVGEGAGRYVGQKRDQKIGGGDGVDLQLVEAARAQEERIDCEDERWRETVEAPDAIVAAGDRSKREARLSSWIGFDFRIHDFG